MERVRTRGDARHQRQRHHHLLDRKLRPDGRPHRRLHHRRPGADPHRPRISDDARRFDCRNPRDRRRNRRLQHPVRRESLHRTHGRHRDEPARVAFVSASLESHRLPDREDRREARRRLYPRRNPQRHHAKDAGVLRAHTRLRSRKNPEVAIRKISRRR